MVGSCRNVTVCMDDGPRKCTSAKFVAQILIVSEEIVDKETERDFLFYSKDNKNNEMTKWPQTFARYSLWQQYIYEGEPKSKVSYFFLK